jgi:hypothetical protein
MSDEDKEFFKLGEDFIHSSHIVRVVFSSPAGDAVLHLSNGDRIPISSPSACDRLREWIGRHGFETLM